MDFQQKSNALHWISLKNHFFNFYIFIYEKTKYKQKFKKYENLETNKKKWSFNGNSMLCIGFPLKTHFFSFYLFMGKIKKIQNNAKRN